MPSLAPLTLGLFSGIGFLDRCFEDAGFCVVRGPDLLWGHDIRGWHPVPGFAGVIAGVPCQHWSPLAHMVRHVHGEAAVAPDLFPELERVVAEAGPLWFLTECAKDSPVPRVPGYEVTTVVLDNRWIGDGIGQVQRRRRRFCFGTRTGAAILDCSPDLALLEAPESEYAVHTHSNGAAVPVKLNAVGKPKRAHVQDCSPDFALFEHPDAERAVIGSGAKEGAFKLDRGGRERPWFRRHVQDVSPDVALLESAEAERAVVACGHKDGTRARPDPSGRKQTLPGNQPRRSVARCLELQGWPPDFLDDAPFTVEAKYRLVGNGVSRPMGLAVARAVARAVGYVLPAPAVPA